MPRISRIEASDAGSGVRLAGLRARYDLIVVGGGIYGAAVAWEAVSRGLSAILLEKDDFGSGTSANSLKIIHGGIRYLQDLDLVRVRESIRERRALARIAPHLIEPLECVIPTDGQFTRSKLALRIALTFYDAIACDRNRGIDPARYVNSGDLISLSTLNTLFPYFTDDRTTGAARWYDTQVYNSERLVLSFIFSAKDRGAHVFNYAAVEHYIVERGRTKGVLAVDQLSGQHVEILGDAVVDCTGPWAYQNDWFERLVEPNEGPRLARAFNFVVRRPIGNCALGFRPAAGMAAEGANRLLFAVPWRDGAIIGTWYTANSDSPEAMVLADNEVKSPLAEINSVFPRVGLIRDDITLVHVGMLPIDGVSEKTGKQKLRRKSRIIDAHRLGGPTGLFWVQGVKYTTARHVAVCTIDSIARNLKKTVARSISATTPLYGGDIEDFDAFLNSRLTRYGEKYGQAVIERLVRNYGTNIDLILEYAARKVGLGRLVPGTSDAICAELEFVMDREIVYTLSDVLLRRTDIGSFGLPHRDTIEFCADVLAERYGWDRDTRRANIQSLYKHYPSWVVNRSTPREFSDIRSGE